MLIGHKITTEEGGILMKLFLINVVWFLTDMHFHKEVAKTLKPLALMDEWIGWIYILYN